MAAWTQRWKGESPYIGGPALRTTRLRLARRWHGAPDSDLVAEQLVEDSRQRVRSPLTRREGLTHGLLAAAFLGVAIPLAAFAPTDRHPTLLIQALLVVAFAVALRVDFEVGAGVAVPTELVLVPMLFTMPVGRVPLAVAAATLLAQVPDLVGRERQPPRLVITVANASYSLAPALVFLFWSEPGPVVRQWPVVAAALAAQFAFDGVVSTVREWFALRVHPVVLVRPLLWTFGIDALLAPIGLLGAVAARDVVWALFLPVPLLALIGVFSRERAGRLDQALELSSAYRGTALLLGDLVEADNPYTGMHSRKVVGLVGSVCRTMGLDARSVQLAEFTALLHDIGKIRIPAAIIDKQEPLSADEAAIMRAHTLEGERLLRSVGGLLAEVGALVRGCHERWDGRGYPDGLAGDAIPLISRIVCCCDAYDAMCSDRSYRSALSMHAARVELISCRGSQFDPAVVDALLQVLGPPQQVAA
ncbi:MAG TPA: HD-GYP domain-containing protein [Gaiellaceae bacterium]|nr:HD-GYP domain-containing protein [Gaiellaceae bacterium]